MRDQQPSEKSTDPSRCFQREPLRHPTEGQVEGGVRFCGGDEEVACTPIWLPETFGFNQIVGLVDHRCRVASKGKKSDQQSDEFKEANPDCSTDVRITSNLIGRRIRLVF